MQKQKEKQKQKPRQVEFTAEIIAAHVEMKAQKRAPAERWVAITFVVNSTCRCFCTESQRQKLKHKSREQERQQQE